MFPKTNNFIKNCRFKIFHIFTITVLLFGVSSGRSIADNEPVYNSIFEENLCLPPPIIRAEPEYTSGPRNTIESSMPLPSGSIMYEFQVSEEEIFQNVISSSGLISVRYYTFINLEHNRLYYYRVRLFTVECGYSDWSNKVSSRQDAFQPKITDINISQKTISPANEDNIYDNADFSFKVSDENLSFIKVQMINSRGTTVREYNDLQSEVSILIDGRDGTSEYLTDGIYILRIIAKDFAGNVSDVVGRSDLKNNLRLIIDNTPGEIEIEMPADFSCTNQSQVFISGVSKENITIYAVNSDNGYYRDIYPDLISNAFQVDMLLSEGENRIQVIGKDEFGNELQKTLTLYYDQTPPLISKIDVADSSTCNHKIINITISDPVAETSSHPSGIDATRTKFYFNQEGALQGPERILSPLDFSCDEYFSSCIYTLEIKDIPTVEKFISVGAADKAGNTATSVQELQILHEPEISASEDSADQLGNDNSASSNIEDTIINDNSNAIVDDTEGSNLDDYYGDASEISSNLENEDKQIKNFPEDETPVYMEASSESPSPVAEVYEGGNSVNGDLEGENNLAENNNTITSDVIAGADSSSNSQNSLAQLYGKASESPTREGNIGTALGVSDEKSQTSKDKVLVAKSSDIDSESPSWEISRGINLPKVKMNFKVSSSGEATLLSYYVPPPVLTIVGEERDSVFVRGIGITGNTLVEIVTDYEGMTFNEAYKKCAGNNIVNIKNIKNISQCISNQMRIDNVYSWIAKQTLSCSIRVFTPFISCIREAFNSKRSVKPEKSTGKIHSAIVTIYKNGRENGIVTSWVDLSTGHFSAKLDPQNSQKDDVLNGKISLFGSVSLSGVTFDYSLTNGAGLSSGFGNGLRVGEHSLNTPDFIDLEKDICFRTHNKEKKYTISASAEFLSTLLEKDGKSYSKFLCSSPYGTFIPEKAKSMYLLSYRWNPKVYPGDYLQCTTFVYMSYNLGGDPLMKERGNAITMAQKDWHCAKYGFEDGKSSCREWKLVDVNTYKNQLIVYEDGKSSMTPEPGDIMIWKSAPYGHVGIITSKVGNIISVAQANSSTKIFRANITEGGVINILGIAGSKWLPSYWARKIVK